MKLVCESKFVRNFFNENAGFLETICRIGHFQIQQILIRALRVKSFKQSAQIRMVNRAGISNILERIQGKKFVLYVLSTILISQVRPGRTIFFADKHFGNSIKQVFQND